MANHSITESVNWVDSLPQVPDAGPTSFMTNASATIEAFVTLLASRSRYLRNNESYDARFAEAQALGSLKLLDSWTGAQPRATLNCAYTPNYVPCDGGKIRYLRDGSIGTFCTVSNGYTGTFWDTACSWPGGGTFSAIAVGQSGEVQVASSFLSNVFTRKLSLGAATDFLTCDCSGTNVFVIGGTQGVIRRCANMEDVSPTFTSPTSVWGTSAITAIRFFETFNKWILTTAGGHIATSPDGNTWTLAGFSGGSAGKAFIRNQLMYFKPENTLAALYSVSTNINGMAVSTDGGANWTVTPEDSGAVNVGTATFGALNRQWAYSWDGVFGVNFQTRNKFAVAFQTGSEFPFGYAYKYSFTTQQIIVGYYLEAEGVRSLANASYAFYIVTYDKSTPGNGFVYRCAPVTNWRYRFAATTNLPPNL